jgi:NAD(P)H-hydrate epimerase
VACSQSTSDLLQRSMIEAMTVAFPDDASGGLGAETSDAILALARERDVLALGPGLGTAPGTASLIVRLVAAAETPLVLDADALNALAARPDVLKRRSGVSMLTPHPGEAARFLGITPAEVNRDRIGAARRLAELTASVVLLKGAATVVAAPDARMAVIAAGGPVLGTGGTGDVLTGLAAALMAQGVEPFGAAVAAAHVHGSAGDDCAVLRGDAGTLAHEIADAIPAVMKRLHAPPHARVPDTVSGGMDAADGVRVDDGADRIQRDDERSPARCGSGLLVPLSLA